MLNDTTISIRGWAGAEPLFFSNIDEATGRDIKLPTAIVNVGVTGRYFNKRNQAWEDEPTTWYSVRCYGALARNVKASVHKGAPLLVRGKFSTRQYQDKNGVERTDIQILADSVALDLNSMIVTYSKMPKADSNVQAEQTSHIDRYVDNLSKVTISSAKEAPMELTPLAA